MVPSFRTPRFQAFSHWFHSSRLQLTQSKSALNRGAPISVESCKRQAEEQCGMAGLSEATILSTAAAATPAPRSDDRVIETSIPSRLDSLPWSGFHTRVVLALGITWILDGLEVTLSGALSGALKESPVLQF